MVFWGNVVATLHGGVEASFFFHFSFRAVESVVVQSADICVVMLLRKVGCEIC